MVDLQPQVLQHMDTADKLRSSVCQLNMAIDPSHTGGVIYRCADPCGRHEAEAARIRAGLLWHYRGRSVDKTFGRPDEEIEADMFSALHTAWVRDGNIYTARFH